MTRNSMPDHIRWVLGQIGLGDVYAEAGESWDVDFDMNRLKSVEIREYAALGLRLFEEVQAGSFRVGQGFVNHENNLRDMLRRAKDQAQWGEEILVDLPEKRDFSLLDTYRDESLSPEEAVEWGKRLVSDLKHIHSKNKVFVSVGAHDSVFWVANTANFWGSYQEKSFSLSCGFSHVGEDGELLYLGEAESRFDPHFDFERFVAKMQRLFEWSQKRARIASGYYPVIFAPEAVDTVLDPLLIALNGSSLYKKICKWEGMEEKQVVDNRITLVDDPFCLEVGDVYPFDDEGVIPQRLSLIENGILRHFIYDLATAKRLGTKSTGHGRRSPASLPQPEFSSLILERGDTSLEDMIHSIEKGLLVYSTLGGGMSNVVAGDFSVNVELGFLIEHGTVRGRVKNTMIRGNAFELMEKVLFVGSEAEVVHGMKVPPLAFERVSVTGEEE